MPRLCYVCREREVSASRSRCQPCNTVAVNEWREKNREHHRATQRAYNRSRKQEIINHYGGRCTCCGEHRVEFLCLDHKNNNGQEERRRFHFASVWKIAIKRGFPDDYQVLCYNCNNAKAVYGVCPHQEPVATIRGYSLPAGKPRREAKRPRRQPLALG